MKDKKVLLMATVLFSVFMMFSSVASASSGNWYDVTVEQAGVDNENHAVYVRITMVTSLTGGDPWTGSLWFQSTSDYKAVLATALTCITSNTQATICLLGNTQWSTITGFYMKP